MARPDLPSPLGLALALVAAACTQRNPEFCDSSADCAGGETCVLTAPPGELTHVCVASSSGNDAPLAGDAAMADAPIACTPDAGGCPLDRPICRGGLCTPCATSLECPDPGAPVCQAGGSCAPCGGDPDCATRPEQRCLAGSCVECKTRNDCATRTGRPICETATGACRACRADVECGGLCDLASGTCVAPGDILHLAENGGGNCTAASPCGSIAVALAQVAGSKRWLLLAAGTYREAVTIAGKDVALVASGAVTIDSSAVSNVPVLNVSSSSTVTLRGLRLANAAGGSSAIGVACSGVPTPRLTMVDVRVEQNEGLGVLANPCTLSMSRSRIIRNDGGGVRIVTSDFSLQNNLIVRNGGAVATVGGVAIVGAPPSGGARFEHNTVAVNVAGPTATGGVACEAIASPPRFTSSVVHGNVGNGAQVSGTCDWTFSAIPGIPGDTNVTADPEFVDAANGDFHLQPASPAIDEADPAGTLREDLDGDPRPVGRGPDIGAYEIR